MSLTITKDKREGSNQTVNGRTPTITKEKIEFSIQTVKDRSPKSKNPLLKQI
jgi:hypothetical protein